MDIVPSKQQQDAIVDSNGPVLIIAGAGTGKTFTITQRIIHLINNEGLDPNAILALTFTEKASFEMIERVDKFLPLSSPQVPISTFHSFCDTVLRQDGISIGISPDYQLLTDTDEVFFIRKHLDTFNLDLLRPSGNPTKYISEFVKHFSRLQDEDISPEKYENFVKNDGEIETPIYNGDSKQAYQELSSLYSEYQKLKFKENKFGFGDLIFYTLKLFRDKPNIKNKWQKNFKYVLIDEFQDTNYSQYEMVKLLVDYSKEPNIMVVADDDQSIYKFRGAAVSNVLQFTNDFPNAKRIVLTENRRSVQTILNASYKMIQNNNPDRLEVKEKIDKKLVAMGANLIEYPSPVEFRNYQTAAHEAEGIALEIKDLVQRKDIVGKTEDQLGLTFTPSVKYSDIAILVRANSHSEEIIDALSRNQIPYQFHGTKRLFSEEVVKDLVNFLRIVTNYKDDISMNGLLTMGLWDVSERELIEINMNARKSGYSIFETLDQEGDSKVEELIQIVKDSWKMIKDRKRIWDILNNFIQESGYLKVLTESDVEQTGVVYDITDEIVKESNLRSLSKAFEFVRKFERANANATIFQLLEYIDMTVESGKSPTIEDFDDIEKNAVHIITIHSSKGLEFPVIFIPNCVRNRFPSTRQRDQLEIPEPLIKESLPTGDEHEQEERRLFYVGLTRAKYKAYLTAAVSYGEGKRKFKISPFVVETFSEQELIPKLEKPISYDIKYAAKEEETLRQAQGDKVNRKELSSRLSYSQIEVYRACPRKYWYRYILKVPSEPSASITYGNTIHQTLQEFYESFRNGVTLSKDDLLQVYENNWKSEGFKNAKHEETFKERGIKSLTNFYDNIFDKNTKNLYLESAFSIKVGDNKLVGQIDRIDQYLDSLEIIDYKTGENKKKLDVSSQQIRQLAIYAIAAEQVFGVKAEKLSLLFIDLGEKVTPDIKRVEKMKEKVIQEIGDTAQKILSRDFKATPGFVCKTCDFNKICKYAKL